MTRDAAEAERIGLANKAVAAGEWRETIDSTAARLARLFCKNVADGKRTFYANGYDAGSEMNDELCVNIPGPRCGGDGEFKALSGEGYVHISPGIQGIGDLSSAVYDWRNPVAVVTIQRIR